MPSLHLESFILLCCWQPGTSRNTEAVLFSRACHFQ
uniref:Uncharacterized protein n=1 Tax=Setaria italica TaxID=4555 RepID=K3Y3V3_SETIT